MKSNRFIICFFATTLSQAVIAQVPHQFEAATPALASEVNENFQHVVNGIDNNSASIQNNSSSIASISNLVDINESDIDSLVTDLVTLESQISGLSEQATSKLDNFNQGFHTYSYAAKTANVGDNFSVNGTSFRIIKIPFKEIGSGDEYTIKLPKICNPSCDSGATYLTTYHTNTNGSSDVTIDGYPAHLGKVTESHSYQAVAGFTFSAIQKQVLSLVYVRVGETLLQIELRSLTSIATGTSAQTSDFTTEFDLSQVSDMSNVIQAFDDAIDYIDIELAP